MIDREPQDISSEDGENGCAWLCITLFLWAFVLVVAAAIATAIS